MRGFSWCYFERAFVDKLSWYAMGVCCCQHSGASYLIAPLCGVSDTDGNGACFFCPLHTARLVGIYGRQDELLQSVYVVCEYELCDGHVELGGDLSHVDKVPCRAKGALLLFCFVFCECFFTGLMT